MNSLELLGARIYVLYLEEFKTNLLYTYFFSIVLMNSLELFGAQIYVLKLELRI